MTRLIVSGCNGRMGRTVSRICGEDDGITVVAGVDLYGVKLDAYPVFTDVSCIDVEADAAIDFTNAAALEPLLDYCVRVSLPVVLCTTGYSESQLALIRKASGSIPVFRSFNMSIGINLLTDLIKKAVTVLGDDFDIEIVEKHHKTKLDSPSGTALMLADAARDARTTESDYVYDRHAVRQERRKSEIGISAVRGGTIVGEHTVIFAGPDEIIELKHTACSRDIFASGAVRAAKFISTVKTPGMYDMRDII